MVDITKQQLSGAIKSAVPPVIKNVDRSTLIRDVTRKLFPRTFTPQAGDVIATWNNVPTKIRYLLFLQMSGQSYECEDPRSGQPIIVQNARALTEAERGN
jgi:hypothetical protein